MIKSTDEIVSIYYRRLEHGYPTPSLDRDNVLAEALPMLKKQVTECRAVQFDVVQYGAKWWFEM